MVCDVLQLLTLVSVAGVQLSFHMDMSCGPMIRPTKLLILVVTLTSTGVGELPDPLLWMWAHDFQSMT